MQPKIFLSYSWADKAIADAIDQDWQAVGFTVVRDVRDLAFKQNVADFMGNVARSDHALLVISPHYLRSKNCMLEALTLFRTPDFNRKLLPIITPDANISKAITRLQYVEHWETEFEQLNEQVKQRKVLTDLPGILEELKELQTIREGIEPFAYQVQQQLYATWPDVQRENYAAIFDYIRGESSAVLAECRRVLALPTEEEQQLLLREVAARYPNNSFVLATSDTVAQNAGKYRTAQLILEQMLPLDALLAHTRLGILLTKHLQKPEEAQRHFEQALALEPNNARVLNNLGTLLASQSRERDRAYTCLQRAVDLQPDDAEALSNLGLLLLTQFTGREREAQVCFERVLALRPADAQTHNNLGLLLARQPTGHAKAKEHFKQALTLQPAYVDALNNLGLLLTKGFKQHGPARQYFEQALALHPTFSLAQYNLAQLLVAHYPAEKGVARVLYAQAKAATPTLRRPKLDEFFGL